MDLSWFKNLIGNLNIKSERVNSPTVKIKQETENKIDKAVIYQGLSYTEAKDLVESVIDQKLMVFKNEAKDEYRIRTQEFGNILKEKLSTLPEEEILKLKEPDTQMALLEAATISGRKQNPDLRAVLADLVINRIKNDQSGKEELKNIVYNEAITTIGKITSDQLKIITLCYLLRYVSFLNINSWDAFKNYFSKNISPFIDFNNTDSQFQHIEYAGCGSIGIGSWNLDQIYQQEYSFLFQNDISEEEVNNLSLSEDLKAKVIGKNEKENLFIRFKNKSSIEDYIKKELIESDIGTKIKNLFENKIKSTGEVRKEIEENIDIGKKVFEIWDKNLKHLSLTSVGIAIGATYFEQIVGEKIDINIWIN